MKKKVIIAVTAAVLCAGVILATLGIMASRQREAERISLRIKKRNLRDRFLK